MLAEIRVVDFLEAKGIKQCRLSPYLEGPCRRNSCGFLLKKPLECLLGKHIIKLVEDCIKIE